MSSRNAILGRLREVAPAPRALPDVPMFDTELPPAVDTFRQSLDRLGGMWCPLPDDGNLEQFVRARFPAARVVCSATPEFTGNRDIAQVSDPRDLHDVDVGIVRPAFAVAETGSIWLSEAQYDVNALGYLSQHLIALLDPDDIVGNLHHAYHRKEFFEANYAVLMSGPSATADIEGVLVRGAQGIRSLTVVPLRRMRAAR
ncbi:LutC/YkgG family protein [Paraburkholderia fungorum]|uniref:LutC/YkgG family protein n=1 Tax=Paraburkholderia fungorum TaxID=134537 RepID=UPI002091F4DB|nr:LUD domain-containing protein [Paraburkholderia fungorum]USU21245.1 LUD domain-containing protein [Paraburkholderia fungorum]USU26758.1 LUD domain-containing protein [Paraburkholderia fungorum]